MQLTQIFQKPVDRAIEGGINADDDTSGRLEVEEYVLTNEVDRRLETFLEAYNHYQGANGAWISGFFGSGKSHLLKILAMVLENRRIDGMPVFDLFLPKCEDNAILRGSLQKAASIPSKSILFNIDQKADVISKTQIDALLAVFVKVFDEMCGYYGKQGYIANFERDLDQRGLYEDFKRVYCEIAGIDWSMGREQALLESENIAQAYAQITGTSLDSVNGILDKYRGDYKVSIEDFAVQINNYIERQQPNFRLNFFVDEVGQYIANNVKLMTNLQTIAESLATKCKGRAWIVVTSQQQMSEVIGEMNTQQANDFSKIMARFATRMVLTSQNVAEVIQKRLLLKNEAGSTLLSTLYHQQANNFGTLFNFSDGSRPYRNYRDQQHFINSYPFIPYQFELFQASIQALSLHNAFEGKHSSVGERSMLAVFQEVAKRIANHEVGQLATFDLMYEGISTALLAKVQQATLTAERNIRNPFAVRVLKALFLVKYVKEFKATIHNISVLMIDRFGQDMPQLRRQVEEALNLLEQQTYIQRNGDLYEFLTNEEKDIEEEIKNTEVDSDAVRGELAKIIFDQILKDRKIRFEENSQDFPFARKLDDQLLGRDYETSIHVISPFHEHFDSEETLRMHAMGRDELLLILPADNRLVSDLLMYKRTEKYVQQNYSTTQQESIKRILDGKRSQNQERLRNLESRVKDLVSRSKLFVGGTEIEISSTDPQSRMVRGFQDLIKRTYPNLKMLRGKVYQESEIETYLRPAVGTLFNTDSASLNEAEQEILGFIQSNQRNGVRTTLKALADRFEHKPYGWSLPAIQCILALLSAHSKVELRQDGHLLEDAALVRALRNTQAHQNVVLEPQIEFTAGQVRKLKEFFEDFFDKPAQASEARELGKETGKAMEDRLNGLVDLANNRSLYPFLAELNEPINTLRDLKGKPYTFYLTDLLRQEKTLLDMKERTIAPLLAFWNGAQKTLYDEARQFYAEQRENFAYLDGSEPNQLRELLARTDIYRGSHMQQARGLVETLRGKVRALVEQEQAAAVVKLRTLLGRLKAAREWAELKPAQQVQIEGAFDQFQSGLAGHNLIAVIRDHLRRFEEREYPRLLTQMMEWAHPPVSDGGEGEGPGKPPVEFIAVNAVPIPFEKPWLADETDIERYLQAVREAFNKEILRGKRINLS